MLDAQVVAFCGVALLLAMTPGPDMALIMRNSVRGGRAAGFRTMAGVAVGLVGWGLATALGVAAVLAASATVFTVLKIAGGIYLVFLGVQTLWGLRRGHRVEHRPPGSTGSPFRQGLVTNLLNPKVGAFYVAVLPQFIGPGDSVLALSLVMAGIHAFLGIVWLSTYAWLLGRLRTFFRRPRVRVAFEAVTGTVLVLLGLRVAAERR
jgi:threonine/homoserine/homoserine lactone efflux protein